MRLSRFAFVTVLAGLVAGDAVSDLAAKGRLQINDYLANTSKTCTPERLSVRKEWYILLASCYLAVCISSNSIFQGRYFET